MLVIFLNEIINIKKYFFIKKVTNFIIKLLKKCIFVKAQILYILCANAQWKIVEQQHIVNVFY